MMRTTKQGFTLIEVMIVVVIVAILATIAVPSYQNQIQKTRRGDAKEVATRLAAAQERWFFSNNQYSLDLAPLGAPMGQSMDGYYDVAVTAADQTRDFMIQVVPSAGSAQLRDSACQCFTIDQTGAKSAFDKNDCNGLDTTAECWR